MDQESKKRMRRCSRCIYNHTVSPIELDMDTKIGDFCVYNTEGMLLGDRNLTEDFYTSGQCPANRWKDLPEIDQEAEEEYKHEKTVEHQIQKFGPIVEICMEGESDSQIKQRLDALEGEGYLEKEARDTIESYLVSSE